MQSGVIKIQMFTFNLYNGSLIYSCELLQGSQQNCGRRKFSETKAMKSFKGMKNLCKDTNFEEGASVLRGDKLSRNLFLAGF